MSLITQEEKKAYEYLSLSKKDLPARIKLTMEEKKIDYMSQQDKCYYLRFEVFFCIYYSSSL
jgi:hypothetical protein